MTQDPDSDRLEARISQQGSPLVSGLAELGSAAATASASVIAASLGLDPLLVAAAGVGAAGGVGVVREVLRNRAVEESLSALAERGEDISKKLAQGRAAGTPLSDADIAAILECFLGACAQVHDRRVREAIRDATVHAFDPAVYEKGLSRRVLDALGRLEFPELDLLAQIRSGPIKSISSVALEQTFGRRLAEERLALAYGPVGAPMDLYITDFGKELLRYLDERGGSD